MDRRQKAIKNIERFIIPAMVNDYIFFASRPGSRTYVGDAISAEEAFFLTTERGMMFEKKDVLDFDRYKSLICAHRVMSITVAMWEADIFEGLLSIQELVEDGFEDIAIGLQSKLNKKQKWWIGSPGHSVTVNNYVVSLVNNETKRTIYSGFPFIHEQNKKYKICQSS